MSESLLCMVGIHRNTYRTHVEHGCIDGPPRVFASVTCDRCGRNHLERYSESVINRAKKDDRARGVRSSWWY
jgi:hypothetical protein